MRVSAMAMLLAVVVVVVGKLRTMRVVMMAV